MEFISFKKKVQSGHSCVVFPAPCAPVLPVLAFANKEEAVSLCMGSSCIIQCI